MKLTENFIQSLARNEKTFARAQELVESNAVRSLFQNTEGTLYFGKIEDGDETYFPSSYFIDSTEPVFQCGCSGSHYPCEHELAMLLSFASDKAAYCGPAPLAAFCRFDSGPLESMLRNIDHDRVTPLLNVLMDVEDLVRWLLKKGLLAVKEEQVQSMEVLGHKTNELGLKKLAHLLLGLERALTGPDEDRCVQQNLICNPRACEISLDLICQLQACIEHNRDFLHRLYSDESLSDMPITRFLNQPWIDWNQDLLLKCGLTLEDAQLIQLGVYSSGSRHSSSYDDDSVGFWVSKKESEVFLTNQDSFSNKSWASDSLDVHNEVVMPELAFVVPGYINHGVCWDDFRSRYLLPEDLLVLREKSHLHWGPVIEKVKESWLDPLSDKNPVALLLFERLLQDEGNLFIESSHNERLSLTKGVNPEDNSVLNILKYLPFELRERQSLLVSFYQNEVESRVDVKPMALVTDREVIRLIS